MSDCIFCKIASREIDSTIFYEDDWVVAFDDLNPQAPVHSLIVPKEHHANIGDGVSEELMGHIFSTVPKVAKEKGIYDSGYRIVVNTGKDACQTVEHMHVHVVGGVRMGEQIRPSEG